MASVGRNVNIWPDLNSIKVLPNKVTSTIEKEVSLLITLCLTLQKKRRERFSVQDRPDWSLSPSVDKNVMKLFMDFFFSSKFVQPSSM